MYGGVNASTLMPNALQPLSALFAGLQPAALQASQPQHNTQQYLDQAYQQYLLQAAQQQQQLQQIVAQQQGQQQSE
jgi:hypothetical protein